MNSNNKAAISLTTGLEDPERVTVAFLVALGAAEAGRPTMMFREKRPRAWPWQVSERHCL